MSQELEEVTVQFKWSYVADIALPVGYWKVHFQKPVPRKRRTRGWLLASHTLGGGLLPHEVYMADSRVTSSKSSGRRHLIGMMKLKHDLQFPRNYWNPQFLLLLLLPSGRSFARGRPLRMIICKRPVPPDDYLERASPSEWSFARGRPTTATTTATLYLAEFFY